MALVLNNKSDISDYLDYNYGVNDTDFSISYIQTPNGNVILKSGEIENPLFVGENGGNLLKLTPKDIYSGFSRVFVICMRDNYVNSPELFNYSYSRIIDKSLATTIASNYVFIKASLKLLNENYYKRCANVVGRELLSTLYNFRDSSLENEEIIIPMFELTESAARMNLSLYDNQYGITDVKKFLSLTQFYNKKNHKNVTKHLSEHIANLRESQFWSNQRNCNINMTDKFKRRGFVTRDIKQKSNANKVLEEIKTSDKLLNSLSKKNDVGTNYVHFDNEQLQTDPYIDLHTVLKTSKNRTYYIDDLSKLELSKDEVTEIFMNLETEKEMYNFFNTLAVSKEYCHTVVNNKEILIKMKPLFNKYLPVYKLIFGYAWLSFVLEEYIMKSKSTIDSRFVFDLDTATHLPNFPYIFEDVHQNPYIVSPIDQNVLNASSNAMSLFCIDDYDGYGVCDQETFRTRINLITTGNPNTNILDGIDWNVFAITGSSITACVQKKSPLFLNVEKKLNINEDTLMFFNSYYNESDLDLMCNEPSIFGFTEKTNLAIKQIKKNVGDEDVTVDAIKSLYICLSKHFFSEKHEEINEALGTSYSVDQLIEHVDSVEFKEYLYPLYVINKQKSNSSFRKSGKQINEYMQHFMNFSSSADIKLEIIQGSYEGNTFDSDISIFINDFRTKDNQVDSKNNHLVLKICEGVKFKISSKKIRKPIELFRCKSNDFFGVVGKFHLPCVRSYHQNNKVFLMPTEFTSMSTGINLDYRYFVGVKNQFDILNKYIQRGYGTFLSPQELKEMKLYNKNEKFGGKELTDPIFRPLEFKQGISGIYNSPNVKYIKTLDDLRNYYNKKCGYNVEKFGIDMMKFTTYSKDGNINPFINSICSMYYEIANNQNKMNKNLNYKLARYFFYKLLARHS